MRVAALLLRVAAVRVQGAAFGWQAQDCMLVASDSRPILMAGAAFGDALGRCKGLCFGVYPRGVLRRAAVGIRVAAALVRPLALSTSSSGASSTGK